MLGSLFSADSPIDAYLLVYDITSRTSLETLEIFDELIQKNVESGLRPANSPAPVKVVAGNKSDLSEARTVPSAEGYAWAKAHGCGFMETSAKVMVNIEETFEIIIRQVVRNREEAANGGPKKDQKQAQISNSGPSNTQQNMMNSNINENIPQAGNTSTPMRPNAEKPTEEKKRGCCVIC